MTVYMIVDMFSICCSNKIPLRNYLRAMGAMNHHKQKGVRRGAGVGGAAGGAPGAAGEVQLRAALRSVTEDDPDQGGAAEGNSSQGMDDGCKSA